MNLNLTSLIRKLEKQLKNAEKLSSQYDSHARHLRTRLSEVAEVIGRKVGSRVGSLIAPPKGKIHRKKKRNMSVAGRARLVAAQKKRWAAYRAKKNKAKK